LPEAYTNHLQTFGIICHGLNHRRFHKPSAILISKRSMICTDVAAVRSVEISHLADFNCAMESPNDVHSNGVSTAGTRSWFVTQSAAASLSHFGWRLTFWLGNLTADFSATINLLEVRFDVLNSIMVGLYKEACCTII
jgi:hypothetical protein